MAEDTLPNDFQFAVFKKFREGPRENDPDASFAMQLFLLQAKNDPAFFATAQADIENNNNASISAFIENVRSDLEKTHAAERATLVKCAKQEGIQEGKREAYKEAEINAKKEIETSFFTKSFRDLNGVVNKIEGSTSRTEKLLAESQIENATLRQELREAYAEARAANKETREYRAKMQKKLDALRKRLNESHDETKAAREEAKEAREETKAVREETKIANTKLDAAKKRAMLYFKISLPISLTSLAFGMVGFSKIAADKGWFKTQSEITSDKASGSAPSGSNIPSATEKKTTLQEAGQLPSNKDVPPGVIPLQNDKQLGPYDPVTGFRMIELLEQGKILSLPDDGPKIYLRPDDPTQQKMVAPIYQPAAK
jgi:hypothetical protein